MSNSIKISPKYGLNPTIPSCFWCGKPKNMIALMGRIGDGRKKEDIEAPMGAVIDYDPCDECKAQWEQGFTILEALQSPLSENQPPIQEGLYPTGRLLVIKTEVAKKIFPPEYTERDRLFCDREVFEQLLPEEE